MSDEIAVSRPLPPQTTCDPAITVPFEFEAKSEESVIAHSGGEAASIAACAAAAAASRPAPYRARFEDIGIEKDSLYYFRGKEYLLLAVLLPRSRDCYLFLCCTQRNAFKRHQCKFALPK
jgi:hypothetical protein